MSLSYLSYTYTLHSESNGNHYYRYQSFDDYCRDFGQLNTQIHLPCYVSVFTPSIINDDIKYRSKYSFNLGDVLIYNIDDDVEYKIPSSSDNTDINQNTKLYDLNDAMTRITLNKDTCIPIGICIRASSNGIGSSEPTALFMSLKPVGPFVQFTGSSQDSGVGNIYSGARTCEAAQSSLTHLVDDPKYRERYTSNDLMSIYDNYNVDIVPLNYDINPVPYGIDKDKDGCQAAACLYYCVDTTLKSKYKGKWYIPTSYDLYYNGINKISNLPQKLKNIYSFFNNSYVFDFSSSMYLITSTFNTDLNIYEVAYFNGSSFTIDTIYGSGDAVVFPIMQY